MLTSDTMWRARVNCKRAAKRTGCRFPCRQAIAAISDGEGRDDGVNCNNQYVVNVGCTKSHHDLRDCCYIYRDDVEGRVLSSTKERTYIWLVTVCKYDSPIKHL